MITKAYFMIKMVKRDGYRDALRDLQAMPEIKSVELVSGEYDLMAMVEAPVTVAVVAKKIRERGWVERLYTLGVETVEPNPFLDEVCSIPGGEGVLKCVQCGMCTASCPNINRMVYSPRKIIALIRAGRRDEVLASNSMWVCASCYLCTVRCPRGVKPTELMHALECLAVQHRLSNVRTSTPAMYQTFVGTIRRNGRIHELGFMGRFYLRTFFSKLRFSALRTDPLAAVRMASLVKMVPMGLALLGRGRLPIRPKKIKGIEQLRDILNKAQSLGEVR